MAMTVAVAMTVETMRRASEAAIDRAAIGPTVRAWHDGEAGAATLPRHKAHGDRAHGRSPHHGQNDAARTFHGFQSLRDSGSFLQQPVSIIWRQRGKRKPVISQHRAAFAASYTRPGAEG